MAGFVGQPPPTSKTIDFRSIVAALDPAYRDPQVVYEFPNGRKFKEIFGADNNPGGTFGLSGPFTASGNFGEAYSSAAYITGGIAPYVSPVVASGALPPGLTLSFSPSGILLLLAGSPTARGTFSGTITVNDSSTPAQTSPALAFSITIV